MKPIPALILATLALAACKPAATAAVAPNLAGDQLWATLATTKVTSDLKTGSLVPTIPASVKSISGKRVKLNGFMMPLEQSDMTSHFLLSKIIPSCYFCPPPDATQAVEIKLDKPIAATTDPLEITGVFDLQAPDQGLFFVLNKAEAL